jgi:hypothetical protein
MTSIYVYHNVNVWRWFAVESQTKPEALCNQSVRDLLPKLAPKLGNHYGQNNCRNL